MRLVRNITEVLFCEKTFHLPLASQNDYTMTTENVVDHENGYDIEESNGSLKIEDEIEWLTTNEAAAYMRLSVGSFRNMVSDGHIPHFKLGRRNRYKRSELRNLLSSEARGRMYYDKI
jgi:excisionase family DNA binding protein